MKTSKRKPHATPAETYQSAPPILTPQLEPTLQEIQQRAHALYLARGGMDGLALNDWLQAEAQLKREFEK
jgi:hypothetical protein